MSLVVLSWNILHGGGSRMDNICHVLRDHNPDIVTLQEIRRNKVLPQLLQTLEDMGLVHCHVPATEQSRDNTVLVASCHEFSASVFPCATDTPVRCLQADFAPAGLDLTLIGAHLPQKKAQLPYMNALLELPQNYRDACSLICGDLNCGIPFEDSETKTFFAAPLFRQLLKQGWVDAWRSRHPQAREFSWYSTRNNNGFRYDQALASSALNRRLTKVTYDHTPREQKFSDHSVLRLELEGV